jgi:hypothetical protein
MGREPETGCFAWRWSQKQAPTKTGESYPKPETGRFGRRFGHSENRRAAGPPRSKWTVAFSRGACRKNRLRPKTKSHIRKQKRGVSREASVVLRNREPQRPLVPNRKWCFRVALLEQTSSGQKYYLLRESRKRAFCMRLLSFCKVEQTIAHQNQKVVFPSFWALPASPSNHRPASFLLILLRPVARSAGPCMPTALSPTMPVVHVTVHPRGQTHAAQNLGIHRCYESVDRFCCHLVDNGGVN